MSLNFEEACNLINDLPKFTTKHTDKEGMQFLECLGHPEEKMRIIHVAGTNGKGSVCIYMESILIHAGFNVGCFISPHLSDIRERVRLCGEMCTEEEFASACSKVYELAKKLYFPTYFEFLFFVGMIIFAEHNVDVLILETGLGGRLDATNIPVNKEMAVIASVGMDHMQYLGNTIDDIAREKAGIMRPDTYITYWVDELYDTKKRLPYADALHACATEKKTVEFALSKGLISDIHLTNAGIDFCLRYRYDNSICLTLPTKALYQVENASLAVCSLAIWDGDKRSISDEAYLEGIAKAFWPGRMEEIRKNVFVDGAHNEPAIRALVETVSNDGANRRCLIFGCMNDKDFSTEADILIASGLFERIITVDVGGSRALKSADLAKTFEESVKRICGTAGNDCAIPAIVCIEQSVHCYDDLKVFIEPYTGNEGSFVYIAGSLYLVGAVRES